MKGHKNAPEVIPETIDFSKEEREELKGFITENIKKLDRRNSISVGTLFNVLKLLPMRHLPYKMENVEKWNNFIIKSRAICIERLRDNATHMPKVITEKLEEFLQRLVNMGIIDVNSLPEELSRELQKQTSENLHQVLDKKSPTK